MSFESNTYWLFHIILESSFIVLLCDVILSGSSSMHSRRLIPAVINMVSSYPGLLSGNNQLAACLPGIYLSLSPTPHYPSLYLALSLHPHFSVRVRPIVNFPIRLHNSHAALNDCELWRRRRIESPLNIFGHSKIARKSKYDARVSKVRSAVYTKLRLYCIEWADICHELLWQPSGWVKPSGRCSLRWIAACGVKKIPSYMQPCLNNTYNGC